VLSGKDTAWHVTGGGKASSPFNVLVPQVLFWLFLTLTSLVAIWRDWDNRVLTLATVWNLINTAVLSAFLLAALREARAIKRASRSGSSARTTVAGPVGTGPVPVQALRTQIARPLPRSHDEFLELSAEQRLEQQRRDDERRHLLEARLAVADEQHADELHAAEAQHAEAVTGPDRHDTNDREKVVS
jgi:cellulose synthase (UDP-forming)